jgi:hypothetical protein
MPTDDGGMTLEQLAMKLKQIRAEGLPATAVQKDQACRCVASWLLDNLNEDFEAIMYIKKPPIPKGE